MTGLPLAILVFGAVQGSVGGAACPVDGAALSERPRVERLRAIGEASSSHSEECLVRARLAAALDDRFNGAACRTLDWSRNLAPTLRGRSVLAVEAELAWRCGRLEEARESALAAIAEGPDEAPLAWLVLGRAREAEWRPRASLTAFERALAQDGRRRETLWQLSGVADTAERRLEVLRLFLEVGVEHGERHEKLSSARQTEELIELLRGRRLWVVESAELPGVIDIAPVGVGRGSVAGWVAKLPAGGKRPLRALVDTGASGLHLADNVVRKLEVEWLQDGMLFGGGGGGRHAIRRAILPRVSVGPMTFGSALAAFADRSLHDSGAYQAILGADVLAGLRLRFSPPEKAILIEKGDGGRTVVDPLEPLFGRCRESEVPIHRVEGQALVTLNVATENGEIERLALFDTGAERTLFDRELADEIRTTRLGGSGARLRGYGGTIGTYGRIPRATVAVGPRERELDDVPVIDFSARGELIGARVSAILGWDFIGLEPFTIDMSTGCLDLTVGRSDRDGD